MQGAIWEATTAQPGQDGWGGQPHVMTDGGGGQGCGCTGCCSTSSTAPTNAPADLDATASTSAATVTDAVATLFAPGDLDVEDALLIWTGLNTLLFAWWAYREVSDS